jgi:ADP-heptose:LPS heptosyltransferase
MKSFQYPKRRPPMRYGYVISNGPKAFVYFILNNLLVFLLRAKRCPPPKTERILIALGGHIGDCILGFPTVVRVRDHYPNARIGILVPMCNKSVVSGIQHAVDEVHVFDHPGLIRERGSLKNWLHSFFKWMKWNHALNSANYQTSIDLNAYRENWTPFLFLSNIPTRIGWKSGGFEALQTHTVDRIDSDRHISDYPRDLLRVVNSKMAVEPMLPYYRFVGEGRNPFGDSREYILLHIGAGAVCREWVDSEWHRLLKILDSRGCSIVLCGSGIKEVNRANNIVNGFGSNVINLVGKISWSDYVGVMSLAKTVICLESSAQHLAAALSKQVVVIYGGITNWHQWGPGTSGSRIVTYRTPCYKCYRSACDYRHCLTFVKAEHVMESVGV